MATPLLRTKLYIPSLRSEVLSRPQLLQRIDSSTGRKLTLISAPAGFGKTTLLSDWISSRKPRVAWISLDEQDNDTSRFLAYLLAALRTIDSHLGDCASETLEASQPLSLQTVFSNLINEIDAYQHRFSLVLDDYHVITNPKIHDALVFLLENLPANFHLFVLSRADPPWPLARLRARQNLIELRVQDLRLTAPETSTFLTERMGLQLTERDIAELDARTEGWIAGLQMAALSMQGRKSPATFIRAFSGSHRYILDYLIEEVLEQQPPEIQNFLLKTSILTRFTRPLCEAVLQAGLQDQAASLSLHLSTTPAPAPTLYSVADMLSYLEGANLFVIPLDDERTWYRYHHLFADLLKNRLKIIKPSLIPGLHLAASRWYEEAGYPDEAISHAIAAEDLPRAAVLIEQHGIEAVQTNKEITLSNWLAALPENIIRKRPWLCYLQAYVYHWTGERDRIEELLQAGEAALAATAAEGSSLAAPILDGADRTRMPGYIAALRAHAALIEGDIPRVISEAERAIQFLNEGDFMYLSTSVALGGAYWAGGDVHASEKAFRQGADERHYANYPLVGGAATAYYAHQLIKQGRLHEAHETLAAAYQRTKRPGGRLAPISGFIGIKLGDILLEWNQVEEAGKYIEQSVNRCEILAQADVMGEAYVSLTRYHLTVQNLPAARASLQKGFEVARTCQIDPWITTWLETCQIRIWLKEGDLNAAVRWAEACKLDPEAEISYHQDLPLLNLARVTLAQGLVTPKGPHLDQALDLLARLQEAARAAGWTHERIQIQIMMAVAHQANHQMDHAMANFETALTLAEPGGYVRVFLEAGKPVENLLEAVMRQSRPSDYVRSLADALKNHRSPPARAPQHPGNAALIEPLSTRELEVLRYLTTSLSAPEIARELYISTSTVRSHVKNIYGKLAVHRRMDAIERARELKLI